MKSAIGEILLVAAGVLVAALIFEGVRALDLPAPGLVGLGAVLVLLVAAWGLKPPRDA